jgi:hypothetical protein
MSSVLIDVVDFNPREKTGNFVLKRKHQSPRTVTVTRRGLLNVASPPRDTANRFLEFLGTFAKIAERRLNDEQHCECITITAEDARRWLGAKPMTFMYKGSAVPK